MRIRDYLEPDQPWLYDICLRTGLAGADASAVFSDRWMLGAYYAAPYAVADPRAVLILADEWSRPAGYILGTADSHAYYRWFNQDWLPALAERYPPAAADQEVSEAERGLRQLLTQPVQAPDWAADYPGHLHIDLLPAAQGQGWGRSLMDAFAARLASLGCPAWHLGVSRQNSGGIGFYQRYGMKLITEDEDCLYFGQSL